jgi:anti-sigma regulatory factor (Ser/Thr protein kinase)
MASETTATRFHIELEPMVGAARRARELVTEACARWGLPELTGPAQTAITELVNNVVVHARTPMTVRLTVREQEMHIAVRDYSHRRPQVSEPTPYGGRGLRLLDAVAHGWGCTPLKDGKIVWAVVARP